MSRLESLVKAVVGSMRLEPSQVVKVSDAFKRLFERAVDATEKHINDREAAESQVVADFACTTCMQHLGCAGPARFWVYAERAYWFIGSIVATLVIIGIHIYCPAISGEPRFYIIYVPLVLLILSTWYNEFRGAKYPVQIVNGIRIRRPFRAWLDIPFDQIQTVQLKRYVLHHTLIIGGDDVRVPLASNRRGCGAAAVVLSTLRPDLFAHIPLDDFYPLILKPPVKRRFSRCITTGALVLFLLAMMVRAVRIWQGFDSGLFMAVCTLVAILLILFVIWSFRYDVMRGTLMLPIWPLAMVALIAAVFAFVPGSVMAARVSLGLTITVSVLALLLLHWKGSRRMLTILVLGACIVVPGGLALWSRDWLPVAHRVELGRLSASFTYTNYTWNGDHCLLWLEEPIFKSNRRFLNWFKPETGLHRIELIGDHPPKEESWYLLPNSPADEPYFWARWYPPRPENAEENLPTDAANDYKPISALYRFDLRSEKLRRIEGFPPGLNLEVYSRKGNPCWSPNRRRLVGSVKPRDGNSNQLQLVVFDLDDKTATQLDGGLLTKSFDRFHWLDNETLIFSSTVWEDRVQSTSIMRVMVGGDGAAATVVRHWPGRILVLPGVSHGIVTERVPAGGVGQLLMDLDTGEKQLLHMRRALTNAQKVAWRSPEHVLVYPEDDHDVRYKGSKLPKDTLYSASVTRGDFADVSLDPGGAISHLQFVPDRNAVVYFRIWKDRLLDIESGAIRLEIWDLDTGQILPLKKLDVFSSVPIGPFTFPVMSPDGRYIVCFRVRLDLPTLAYLFLDLEFMEIPAQ